MTVLSPLEAGVDASFLREKAPELARDIVAQIDKASNLAATYGLTPYQWDALRASEHFRSMVLRARQDLSGPAGTAELARRKAALAIEQGGVLDMANIMSDKAISPTARVSAYNALMETAQMGKSTPAMQSSPNGLGGPLIIINLPDRSISVGTITPHDRPVIDAQMVEVTQ